jgi:nitrate reductase gamma subunit
MKLKGVIILIFILGSLNLCVQAAEASWFIDGKRFHISAHGQTACIECHEEISKQELHPNPADVNKRLSDFFDIDACINCHDDVMENLDEGIHGDKKIEDPKKYENCIGCHNPHYQQPLGDDRMGKFDPAKPRHEQCGACHKEQTALPAFTEGDKRCVACHLLVDYKEDLAGKKKILQFCFHCHAQSGTKTQEVTGRFVPLINVKEYQSTPHAEIACTICHPTAASFLHGDQKGGDCRQCHIPHDEKVTHDAHMVVACEACHLTGVKSVRNPELKLVLWEKERKLGKPLRIHEMILEDDEASCQRCHFKGNQVGAVSMILPAKSIICMPCHTATFSIGDTTTIFTLIVFLAGLVFAFSYWLSGSMPGQSDAGSISKLFRLLWNVVSTVFSSKIVFIIKAMILDVLFQRRLYRQSGTRWLIHSLIFFPFVFRFLWGLIALTTSLWAPEWSVAWPMLDKNHSTTAFVFDMTGIMVLLGAGLAFIRGFMKRPDQLPGLPGQDRLALGLIAGIIIAGFVLEGVRIAMTSSPVGSEYAFVGYGIGMLFSGFSGLTEVYGYIWYVHAILTGVFLAYLPFSRLFHVIVGPVVLVMNAVSEQGRRG